MKNFLFILIKIKKIHTPQNSQPLGFSILELLATIVIAGSAVSLLLYLMVEGMTYNQQEQGMSQINKDLKQALNYISEDARKAVYIYNGNELKDRTNSNIQVGTQSGLQDFLPNFGTNVRPILAFWKLEALSNDVLNSLNCDTSFATNTTKLNECKAVKVERRAYTLVVYLQSTDNSSGQWKGESRILRYQLPKYSDLSTLTRTGGYVDPVAESSFQGWPVKADGSNLQSGTLPTTTDPLVDFVANPTTVLDATKVPTCPSNEYVRTPFDDSTKTSDDTFSFFACVKTAENTQGNVFNQDLIIYLKGSPKGKYDTTKFKNSSMAYIKSQVLSRGVVNKLISD
ncbi:PilW family protein [Gloeothece verrucosa]|uniref:Prepilin-type N-terminal cleavage/methylation domain-containing protein n=1 Tax=Gloeothece verrucosa (strain PCC 7822) TaxID=497965 RepID=E0U926_GLOV7|nr:hypothetical protein [Gloeothece verrucosa]ADN16165.1 conserved hypothetical protein [Gloeothece verrucosa PCC 7822]